MTTGRSARISADVLLIPSALVSRSARVSADILLNPSTVLARSSRVSADVLLVSSTEIQGVTAQFSFQANAGLRSIEIVGSSSLFSFQAVVSIVTAPFAFSTTPGQFYDHPVFSAVPAIFSFAGNSGGVFIPPVLPAYIPYESAPRVPVYSFVLCNPYTGEDIEELTDATNRSVTARLRAPSDARFKLSALSSQAALISPLGTGLKVYRDDFLIMRGLVGPASGSIGAGSQHDVEYVAFDYRGVLKRYILLPHDNAVKVGLTEDGEAVGWHYIDTVQQRGASLGIVRGSLGAVGVSSFWRAEANDNVAAAIQRLADSSTTFDWDVLDVDGFMTYQAWAARGVETSYALDLGGSVLECSYTYAPEQYGNAIYVVGSGGLFAEAVSGQLEASPIGRYELAVSDDSLKTQDMVDARAAGLLKIHENLIPTYALKISSKHWSPEQLWLGDSTVVDILPSRADTVRVNEVSIGVDTGESIALTLGQVPPNVILRSAEAYERAGRAQAQVTTKSRSFVQDDEPPIAVTGDFWSPTS